MCSMTLEHPSAPHPAPRRSRLALTSRILGVAALLTSIILPLHLAVIPTLVMAILAFVIGSLALILIMISTSNINGRGVAWTGIILACFLYLVIAPSSKVPNIKYVWNILWDLKEKLYYPEHEIMNRGKYIYIALYSSCEDKEVAPRFDCYPHSDVTLSSTTFFTSIINNRIMVNVDYSFFSAPGIIPYHGTNAAMFKPENNAWCIVADLHETASAKAPILFTRNLKISTLTELKGRVGDQLDDAPPFGRKNLVIVFNDGRCFALKPDMLWSNILGGQSFTNRVLRP